MDIYLWMVRDMVAETIDAARLITAQLRAIEIIAAHDYDEGDTTNE